MDDKTIERLKQLGWSDTRIINVDFIKEKYKEISLSMPENVEQFLEKYGMLESKLEDVTYFDVEFNPLKAIGTNLDANYFRECLSDYDIDKMVYPIGVACRDNLLILMTEEDTFYCFTDSCLINAGNSVEEMLDCLVGECREPEVLE